MDDDPGFGSPGLVVFSGNNSNVRLDYVGSLPSGQAGVQWRDDLEALEKTSIKAASGTQTSFTGAVEAWNTISALGDYFVVGNYTGDETGKNMPTGGADDMSGVNSFGYMYKPFSVVKDTEIEWYSISHKIYDPRSDGLTNELINITLKWEEKGTSTGISGGTAKIDIGQYEVGVGENKYPVIPAQWYQQDMIDNGDGTYSIFIDPTYYAHTGNMSWGYHNLTISLSKMGFLSQTKIDDFDILVDTALTIIDPDQGSLEPTSNHPHYKYAIMGGKTNESSLFTAFSLYFYTNLTSPEYITNTAGNPYNGMVQINYSLTPSNYSNIMGWWNWTWNQEVLNNNEGNPINGSFISSGTQWVTTIYLPQKGAEYFKDIGAYDSGLFFEYNVTVTVLTNRTYPPTGSPLNFQPNLVENQSCEDGYVVGTGGPDTVKEETILVKLINPQEGNFSRLVLLNNPTLDGTPYGMGVYNNDSTGGGTGINVYKNQYYLAKNYYYNSSIGPHGQEENLFRLRILHNGTYSQKQQIKTITNPPSGPINGSYVTLLGWSLNPIPLIEDTVNLWNTTVINNITGLPENYFGSTYVTPWLNFNNKTPGTYSLYIRAMEPNYIEDIRKINLVILEQKT